jgi:hypothetical protein
VVCTPPASIIAFLASELAMALTYYAAWVWLMARSGRLLRLRPWQEYRTANMIFRLEVCADILLGLVKMQHALPC